MSGKRISVETYVFLDNPCFEEIFPEIVLPTQIQPSRDIIRTLSCVYCKEDGGTVDHFVPLSKGGLDQLKNLVPACRECNMEKGSLHPLTWLRILLTSNDFRSIGLGQLLGPELEQKIQAGIPADVWQPYQVWPSLD